MDVASARVRTTYYMAYSSIGVNRNDILKDRVVANATINDTRNGGIIIDINSIVADIPCANAITASYMAYSSIVVNRNGLLKDLTGTF